MTDDLVAKLRDEDSYYRLQEKHWCIDAEELERQRLAAADRIEALEVENERLRGALEESLALNINYHAVEEQDGYQFTEAPAVIEAARAALEPKP